MHLFLLPRVCYGGIEIVLLLLLLVVVGLVYIIIIIIIIIIHKRGYSLQAPWEYSMETHNHTGYTSDRGSPAWKHTFTQEDIQALWWSSINTIGHTSSVGVQHGNTQSHRIYKRPWESSMETHIHTRGYTGSLGGDIHIGRDLVLTLRGQAEDNNLS